MIEPSLQIFNSAALYTEKWTFKMENYHEMRMANCNVLLRIKQFINTLIRENKKTVKLIRES